MEDLVNESTYQLEDLTIKNALQSTFAICRNHNTLLTGSTEVTKCLIRASSEDESSRPELVVLAKDLAEEFQKLIIARCEILKVPVIYVENRQTLAGMLPMKRVKGTGAVCIRDFICDSREKAFIINACMNA